MAYKECDEECLECKHYHYAPAHLTADPYYSTPEELYCDFEWECPYLEEDDEEEEEDE
jgi:hypothetical protein